MPNLSSSLSTGSTAIPAVNATQIGKFAGLHMVFPTIAALNLAIVDERSNVTASSGMWSAGQSFSVATEPQAVERSWFIGASASLSHGRTVLLPSGKSVILTADTNVVLATAGAPSAGTGADGDLAIDVASSLYYVKATGAWGAGTAVGATAGATPVVNDLTTGGTTSALSAQQGVALKTTADTLATTVAGKQATLVSGTNVKTVNGTSILGTGDITIAGGGATTFAGLTDKATVDIVATNAPLAAALATKVTENAPFDLVGNTTLTRALHANRVLRWSGAGNITLTVQTDALAVAVADDTYYAVQLSTGTVTFVAGAGATVTSPAGTRLATSAQGHELQVYRGAANTYYATTATISGAGTDLLPLANTWQKAQSYEMTAVAYAATVTLNAATVSNHVNIGLLTGNLTLANPAGFTKPTTINVWLSQDSVGSRTITLGNKILPVNGLATITLNSAAGSVTLLQLTYHPSLDVWALQQHSLFGTPATAPSGGGSLSFTAVNSVAAVNLTTLGVDDWAQWGSISTAAATVAPHNRKNAGGATISVATRYGGTGLGFTGDSSYTRTVSFTDGDPVYGLATQAAVGVGTFNQGHGTGLGYEVSFPASTTPRQAVLYMGYYDASQVRVTATLSDGSAAAVINTGLTAALIGYGFGTVTVNYAAASAGQTMTIRVEMLTPGTSGFDSCSISAATVKAV